MAQTRLGDHVISEYTRPYIIAEIGVNHEGSLKLARRLIEEAKRGGADAAKFQTYKAETLASRHSPSYWDLNSEPTPNQYQLFKKYDAFGPNEYRELAAYCCELRIDFISTPFDNAAVDLLDPLVPFFKIASADLTNVPLLRKVGSKGKPVVLSTGASNLSEIDFAIFTLREAGSGDVVLLHCVLNYPTKDPDAHLRMIVGLRHAYPEHVIGYSDHTLPDEGMVSVNTAFALGARVIEKHFTHDRTLPGNDHYHAMDWQDLLRLRSQLERLNDLLGPSELKRALPAERSARAHARRSLVLSRALPAGHTLAAEDLVPKRPGTGIAAVHWDEVLGRRIRQDFEEDHVLAWEDLLEAKDG